jgi:excisionase family DNA binding protein
MSGMPDPTSALYVRLPQRAADTLDRAAEALGTNKKELVTTLVSRYLDPDNPEGLESLREHAAAQRRVTVELPDSGITVGHHAFTPTEVPDVLTPAQAAALLQVPEEEIVALAEAGALPGRRIGEHWRFARPALIAWLSER